MTTTDELQFRDTALKISSSADGQLDIDADTEIEIVAPTVDIDASTAMTIDTAALTVTGAVDLNTSLNVDGTVTADALTVNGDGLFDNDTAKITVKSFQPKLILDDDSAVGAGSDKLIIQSASAQSAGDYEFVLNNDQTSSADQTAIKISGNGDISFYDSAGSSQSFYWDAADERLGIGTTLPSVPLHINTSGTSMARFVGGNDGNLYITNDSANVVTLQAASGDALSFNTNGGNERMTIDSSGNVGIDFTPKTMTANVTSSLNVGSGTVFQRTKDTYLGSNMYYNASDVGKSISTGYGLAYYQDVTNGAHKWFTSAVSAGSADATHSFSTPMIIDSSGNVGIGTTSPSQKLTISGGTSDVAMLWNSTDTAYYNFGILKNGSLIQMGEYNNAGDTLAESILNIEMDGNNVGIGTSSPLAI
jgi:hypothetical protein